MEIESKRPTEERYELKLITIPTYKNQNVIYKNFVSFTHLCFPFLPILLGMKSI